MNSLFLVNKLPRTLVSQLCWIGFRKESRAIYLLNIWQSGKHVSGLAVNLIWRVVFSSVARLCVAAWRYMSLKQCVYIVHYSFSVNTMKPKRSVTRGKHKPKIKKMMVLKVKMRISGYIGTDLVGAKRCIFRMNCTGVTLFWREMSVYIYSNWRERNSHDLIRHVITSRR